MTPVIFTLQQELMAKAISAALRSIRLNNSIVRAIQEALYRQEDSVSDLIRQALQLAWYAEHSINITETIRVWDFDIVKSVTESVIQNDVPFRLIDDVILIGIKIMLPLGQLNHYLMATMKDLLVSGQLDDIVQAGTGQLRHINQDDKAAMIEVSKAVPSRHLDGILLDIFFKLVDSGELNDILVSAVTEMLQSGKLDRIIRKTTAPFLMEVRLVNDIVPLLKSLPPILMKSRYNCWSWYQLFHVLPTAC